MYADKKATENLGGRGVPTYEYECENCRGTFEYFQSMSEPPKKKCEECGGKLTKLLSAGSGLIFKGSGFYITDYKKGSGESSKSSGAKKSESSSDGGKHAGSPENKTSGGEPKSAAKEAPKSDKE
jgi:putative FmdB family regulatory protein